MTTEPQVKQPSGTTRRAFLKTSALAAPLAALAPVVHAAGSDVLKVGLIGCGSRGSGAAVNALKADPSVRLVAMADIFEDRLQASLELIKQLKEIKPEQVVVNKDRCFVGFDGYKKVIASDVDLVLIACASRFHPQYLLAAVEADKHVFVEKPHAIDPAGLHLVRAACAQAQKRKKCLASGLCYRYDPAKRETIQRIREGAIGDIVAIESDYLRSGPYGLVPRKPEMREIEYQYRNWYHFGWLSGDDVLQSLIHNLDKACWVLGDIHPLTAHGLGGRTAPFTTVNGDVFDHHAIVYKYDNGLRLYAFGRTQTNCHSEVRDVIHGTKGRCELMTGRITGATNWRYQGTEVNMYDQEHRELYAAIRSGKPINDSGYMVNSTMVAILGQLACYTGQQIAWDDLMKSHFRFGPAECDFTTEPWVKPDEKGNYPVPVPGVTKIT